MSELTRRGFFGTVAAVVAGAVGVIYAKPSLPYVEETWEIASACGAISRADADRLVGKTIRVRLPQRFTVTEGTRYQPQAIQR